MNSKLLIPSRRILYPLLAFILLGTVGYLSTQNINYHGALKVTRKWARLNEFPTTAKNLNVQTQGSIFTREFTVEFSAPLADIEQWLSESPGTENVVPTIEGKIRIYKIAPGDGAQHAELELDESSGHVKINTYWS